MKKFICAIVILLYLPCYADDISSSGVNNIYYVSNGVYRSGQPTADDMKKLEALGVRSILNLREFHSDDDEAKGTSIQLYHVVMAAGSIDDDEMVQALKFLKDAPRPVLIHCWHGSDRTGAVVAMYRIIFEGWDKEAAIKEMQQPQYGLHGSIYVNIVPYIRNANIDALKELVFAE